MLDIDDLTWPLSFRYNLQTPFGFTQIELSVDAPVLNGAVDASKGFGIELYRTLINPLIIRGTSVIYADYIIWKTMGVPGIMGGDFGHGAQFGPSTRRRDNAVLGLHTGDSDRYGLKRLVVPGMPFNWQAEGLLTDAGWDKLSQWGHGLIVGLFTDSFVAETKLINMYAGVTDPPLGRPFGVGFRRVRYLRLCQYTDSAPTIPESVLWPA